MKHLTLKGDLVFEFLDKIEGKVKIPCVKRLNMKSMVIQTSSLEFYGQPIESEIDNKDIFVSYIYYYGKDKAYDKLKEIEFKFE